MELSTLNVFMFLWPLLTKLGLNSRLGLHIWGSVPLQFIHGGGSFTDGPSSMEVTRSAHKGRGSSLVEQGGGRDTGEVRRAEGFASVLLLDFWKSAMFKSRESKSSCLVSWVTLASP